MEEITIDNGKNPENLLEGLVVTWMQQQREEFWKRSTLAHKKTTCQAARELGISHATAFRALNHKTYYSFKPIRVQLNEDDPDRGIELCEFVVRECANDEHWLIKQYFSDESVFHVNRHNHHYYARENPQVIEETHLRCGKDTV
ncbi:hypothetical protein ANN_18921 [Periplaneta americana]|uniref:Uncharacterized protein n=1 Tax=Periplaneta americana TaxID=6978 RepID=A0ABQ8SS89_PERAM|nr:hypothetical protein ANN_18921 [Periplaneta americana]